MLCWFLAQLKVSLQIFVEELNRNLAALQVKLSVLNREHKNLKIFFSVSFPSLTETGMMER